MNAKKAKALRKVIAIQKQASVNLGMSETDATSQNNRAAYQEIKRGLNSCKTGPERRVYVKYAEAFAEQAMQINPQEFESKPVPVEDLTGFEYPSSNNL